MCVIFIAEVVRPTGDMVEKAFRANGAGGGVAWRKDKKTVAWKKGLDVEEMKELCATLPLPYIAHFRIPSAGQARQPELCHPFPIDHKVPLFLEGTTGGYVLFHNGHWSKWKEYSLEAAVKSDVDIPMGRWIDTRAMAWVASIYGLGILEFIDEKAVAFGPADIEVVSGTGWFEIEVGKGTDMKKFWASNRGWENYVGNIHGRGNFCGTDYSGEDWSTVDDRLPEKYRDGADKDKFNPVIQKELEKTLDAVKINGNAGGLSPAETFCEGCEVVSREEDRQETTKQGEKEVRQVSEEAKKTALVPIVAVFPEISEADKAAFQWAKDLNPKLKGKVGWLTKPAL